MEKINHNDKLSVNFSAIKSSLRCFRTKKDAINEGNKFGWRNAVMIEDRFEKCWVVGEKTFEDTYVGNIPKAHFRFPLLRWEKKDGVEFCPVLNIYRVIDTN